MQVNIDRIRRHIEQLAQFTATPGAGSTRPSYTPEYRQACDYLVEQARALALDVRVDAVGNIRVRLAGSDPQAPVVMSGSHLDTVINGGDFDGILGVVGALEVIQTLIENDVRPTHPIEAVNFVEEEGTNFRCPLAGSKALTGVFDAEGLKQLHNDRGMSMFDAAREFGLQPQRLAEDQLQPGEVKAMIELHIEQGAVLESERLAVGVVDRIAGSKNYRVRLQGRANHAGTTPMPLRHDALAAAAEMIQAIETVAAGEVQPTTVATVGRIACLPNASNVIPARVEFSIDLRDIDQDAIDRAAELIFARLSAIAERRRIGWESELTGESSPQPFSPAIVELLDRCAARAGLRYKRMHSGALHDAVMLTRLTDVGMIFVPSIDGRSHTPREKTDYADIEVGANLLLQAIHELAR